MSCDTVGELYCSPAQGAILFENQTYALDYNTQFGSLTRAKEVDIYLYHPDTEQLAQKMPGLPNGGEMSFTIDQVT